jgi:hypothetical protein
MRLAASLALVLLAGAATAAEQGFLFDALRARTYRAAWDRLMKSVDPTPDWLMHFNRNFDGASGEMLEIKVEGKPYQLSWVCEPAKCADHKFMVLFDLGGEHAWGALGGKDSPPAFYGAPPPALQDALSDAFQK